MQKYVEQVMKAFDYANKNKPEGSIFLGDCKAHWSWGDISHGKSLPDDLKHLVTILNDGIDLCIQGRIRNFINISLTTNDETQLITGAPVRRNIPVVVTLYRKSTKPQQLQNHGFKKPIGKIGHRHSRH